MTASACRRRADCRLCGSRALIQACSLGETPLANEFVPADQRGQPQDRFPLDVYLCQGCGHLQLLDVVDPERLFRHYVYVSGTSPVFVDHFRRYAEALLQQTGMPRGSRVLEIGSNDGTLLRCFQDAGMEVLGVDPATAIAAEATRQGLPTLAEFFTPALAERLRSDGWQASLVTANNVFAHADDLHAIVDGVARLLAPEGLFVFEVSYLVDVIEQTLFDTIYHEHLSYHALKPLLAFFERHGMRVVDAQRVASHGGSLRVLVGRSDGPHRPHARVEELVRLEGARGLFDVAAYREFFARIQQRKAELLRLLGQLKAEGKRIVGYGAPAKATTLMHHFELEPGLLDCIIDESPWKQGRYSPGYHLPIVPASHLYDHGPRPDYALILAWNFAESIMAKHQAFREAGGRFIVPLPRVEVH